MADWNPSSTTLKGLEWGPHTAGSVVLDSFTKSAVQSLRQTIAQAIGSARVWVGAIPTRGGVYVVEVYDGETCVGIGGGESTLISRPNQDLGGMGTGIRQWRTFGGSAVNIFEEINNAAPAVNVYIWAPLQYPTWAAYNFSMDTAALGLTTEKILSVTISCIATANNYAGFSLGFWKGANIYRGSEPTLTPTPTLVTRTWATNPATGLPWTIADLLEFDAAGTTFFYVSGGTQTGHYMYVQHVVMEIQVDAGPENRLAIGVLDDTLSALTPNAWNNVTLLTPAGGTWTKQATDWHTYVVRRSSSVGSLVVPTLAATVHPNPAEGWVTTQNPSNGFATAMNDVKPNLYGLILRTTAPAESVDSQPYTVQIPALVKSGQDAEQELSGFAVSNYGGVRAWVKSNNATADLLIKVKRRSDNVQMGQTITVTKVDADALPSVGGGWRELDVQMATGFTAATGTQYYVEFSSAAVGTLSPVFDYWSVLALDTGDQGNGATYGGTTDRALINGTEADRYEIPVTLWILPTAPTNLAAVIDIQEQPEWTALDCEDCLPLIIEYVHLSWTATSLGAGFDHYELQRSDDGGFTWDTISDNAVESTVTFDDFETPRGVASRYRLRSWSTNNARSAWTAVVTAPAAQAVGGELIFTTNADPGLNCAYNRDGSSPMDFEFLNADEVVFQNIYQRDYQVSFHPTEYRGAKFQVPLIINAWRQPTVTLEGMPLFQALRDLSNADIPYVCVLDHYGNRWYAELQVPSGTHAEPGRVYIAQITVTEVRGEPTAVEVI